MSWLLSIVTPLFKSSEFKTKRGITYLVDIFITKPIKIKQNLLTQEISENHPYHMIKFPYQVCEKPVATDQIKMQFAVTNVTVGYTFL